MGYKNENMMKNKQNIVWKYPVFTVLYQKLLATIIYTNRNIAKAQSRLGGQAEENQPHYYIAISMITKTKVQRLLWWKCKHNGTCKINYYYYSITKLS